MARYLSDNRVVQHKQIRDFLKAMFLPVFIGGKSFIY